MENTTTLNWDVVDRVHGKISELFRFREAMLMKAPAENVPPSHFNQRTLDPATYIYKNYKEVIQNLRAHCYHFTADVYLDYVQNLSHLPSGFMKRYLDATLGLPEKYIMKIPEILGEFGYRINGNLVNTSTIRYQLTIRHLYEGGVFAAMKKKTRHMLLDIGAAWGGLIHHLQEMTGEKSTGVIVDIPEGLYLSAMYLTLANPDKKILIYGEDNKTLFENPDEIMKYDFVLVPNYALSALDRLEFDLVTNMISFQEMTPHQVEEYFAFIKKHLRGYFYSCNRNRYPHNYENLSVNELIEQNFEIVRNFEEQAQGSIAKPIKMAKRFLRILYPRSVDPCRQKYLLTRKKGEQMIRF